MTDIKPQIGFVVLCVSDLDASREFYEKTLGFEVAQTDAGYVQFSSRGVPLGLMSHDAAAALTGEKSETSKGTLRFYLSLGAVPDVDKTYEKLRKAGVKFLKPPHSQPWGQRTTLFLDPDDNIWEAYTWKKKE
jgi:lactoylglutathione lyase